MPWSKRNTPEHIRTRTESAFYIGPLDIDVFRIPEEPERFFLSCHRLSIFRLLLENTMLDDAILEAARYVEKDLLTRYETAKEIRIELEAQPKGTTS